MPVWADHEPNWACRRLSALSSSEFLKSARRITAKSGTRMLRGSHPCIQQNFNVLTFFPTRYFLFDRIIQQIIQCPAMHCHSLRRAAREILHQNLVPNLSWDRAGFFPGSAFAVFIIFCLPVSMAVAAEPPSDSPPPDKRGYTLFNPTPPSLMR